ncbi:DUF7619 domain-containing protein [Flavobacterium orientale]|uniref:Secretion system C-terminal sorting domain-containing protein n=1 Tax=Flavobacterium orientale TaxID=1756020 RepID=A0A916Y8L3_9FLAO|nr:choice-of-anchor L domain-containing protein [Flavobacterium orientale]GGD34708.1 hypothetical protein GCM10011343_25750 [Flavobacterium orientale]
MKQTLLYCFFALFFSLPVLSQENAPGEVCSTAIPISSLPYTTTDNTANYGDDYSGTAGTASCGSSSSYLNGDDVFYTFTATSNNPVTITMTPTNTWSGLFVYNSCANIGISCIDGVANSSANPRVIVLPVTAGQTYYIAISSWATSTNSQSTLYTLSIVENTCTNLTASYSVVSDCANGDQFNVVTTIANMGSASSITITSNQGGFSQVVTAPGTVQFGPFPNGTPVVITSQNTTDPNCFSNSQTLTQSFCPASNNLCANAVSVTCGTTVSQSTVGATIAGAPSFTCGTSPGAGGLWYSYVGTGDIATMSLCNSSYDTKIQVLTGSCGAFTCVAGNDDFCGSRSQVTFVSTLGTIYYVYVYGYSTSQGAFTLNVSCEAAPTPPANDACENATQLTVNTNTSCALATPGTITGATPSPQPNTCVGTTNDDVWFQFVATQPSHVIELSNISGSTTNLNHAVFTASNTTGCTDLTLLYCSDPNTSTAQNLTPGQIYYIRIYSSGNTPFQTVSFDVCVRELPPPPANDSCTNAQVLPVNSDTTCTVTSSAILSGATPSQQTNTCSGMSNADIWFEFTATHEAHILTLSNIVGSIQNLDHAVYSAISTTSPCNDLTLIYCSAPNDSFHTSYVVGQTYYLRVYAVADNPSGTATFDICITTPNTPITVSTTEFTVPELIENILINSDCSLASNITWSTGTNFNSVNGIGYFNRNGSDFPFAEGIVLSTGNAASIPGANLTTLSDGTTEWVGDNDLNSIILAATGQPMNSRNATKIEFDFVPQTNFISFDFLFASEEYGTYQCNFADAFAFLLTNMSTGVTTNLAVVPGTQQPVSVVTIRNQLYNMSCTSVNPDFFDTFYGPNGQSNYSAAINFNGITHPLTASSVVVPNTQYRIKLVVADRQDNIFDSAVFIEGGSFALGTQCQNVIQLEAFIDSNGNGVKDAGENPYTLGTFNHNINDAPEMNITYSPSGIAYIVVDNTSDSYDFTYQIYPEVAAYFNTTTSHSNITFNASGNNVYYFPITVTQPYSDVEVNLTATFGPNPGFPYSNTISYKNNGVTPASGTLTYVKDPVLTITSVSQAGTVANASGFTYAFTNLAPNEVRTIQVGLLTPTIPTVALGDQLTNSVSSTSVGDFNANNNSASLLQIVSGSYDPNDKLEAHGPEILYSTFGADDYLYYTIRFQNTGTANAETVIITDFLDSQLDETSIRMISASHAYTMNRIGADLTWEFAAINLVPTLVSEADSQGYVHFKIKPKSGYAVGDIIPNTAQIYFDFNDPIITNTCMTEFVTTLGTDEFTAGNLVLYPNPANDRVTISVNNSTDTIANIRMMDVLGQVVHQQKGTPNETVVDISGLSTGVYLVEIVTQNQFTIVKKLVIE